MTASLISPVKTREAVSQSGLASGSGSGLAVVHVLIGLLVGLLSFGLGVHCVLQLLNGFTQTLSRRTGHLSFQLVKGDAQVMGNMHSRHELAQVLKSLRGLLQVGPCRQKALQLAGEFSVVRKSFGNTGLLALRAGAGT